MCGISGFSGIVDNDKRLRLVWALGEGIDSRGGHASGFISYSNNALNVCKKPGKWSTASTKFLTSAAKGHSLTMHSRWATCGRKHLPLHKRLNEAHPFSIVRDGRTVLYGAHNGMVYNADESAEKNGRDIVVDSEEIFELLADNDLKGLRKLEGYGVIEYVLADDPDAVNIVRLTSNSEIYTVRVSSGGIVWGSTEAIVQDALKFSGLEREAYYELSEVGRVYQIRDGLVYKTEQDGVRFSNRVSRHSFFGSYYNSSPMPSRNASKAEWERWFACEDDEDFIYKALESEYDNDSPSKDEVDFQCEKCDEPLDIEEYDTYANCWAEMYGKQAPLLCCACLWNV